MPFSGDYFAPGAFYVLKQRVCHLVPKIDGHFFPAFSDQMKPIVLKIHIVHIQSYQL